MEACERLVRLLTDEGGTVLDCYAGSGTALAAAVLWGRQFIGFELSEEYAAIANARIAHAQAEAASRLPLEVAR
jgi:site-specific DNA-methyltransferase (adenine-specific)